MDNRIRPINLFSLAPLDPYCVISSLYTDPYDPFELGHVSVDMLNSLRSVKHQFPEHMRELLDDFCAVVFGGQGLFSNSSCYLVGAPIRAWQWNIFKEVRWRVANGGDRVEIIKELKRRTSLLLTREHIQNRAKDGYYNQRWQRLRSEVLEVYGPVCALCGRDYRTHGVVLHGDHIIPKSQRPDIALYFSNIQVLCEDCNMGKSYYYTTDHRSIALVPSTYGLEERISNWK